MTERGRWFVNGFTVGAIVNALMWALVLAL